MKCHSRSKAPTTQHQSLRGCSPPPRRAEAPHSRQAGFQHRSRSVCPSIRAHLALRGWMCCCCHGAQHCSRNAGVIQCSDKETRHALPSALKHGRRSKERQPMMSAQPADIFLLLLGNPVRGAHATCCCQKEQLSPSQERSPPGCSKLHRQTMGWSPQLAVFQSSFL